MSTTVTTAKETAVSTDVMDDIFEYAGEGASFDSSEMQIPFIRLLQPMSPQLNKKKPEYIDGARSSDIFNNVTSQYWDGEAGIRVIACYQTTKYLEFVPLEMGVDSAVRYPLTVTCFSRPVEPELVRSCPTATNW